MSARNHRHPCYNVAPTQIVEAIISVNGEKRLGPMRWGFGSPAGKEPKLAPINARAETLATSPMFRDAFLRHRCLVVPSPAKAKIAYPLYHDVLGLEADRGRPVIPTSKAS